jgi:DNA-binding transcriptional MocR family regulator
MRISSGQVLPTSGNTEALHLALCAVARPGDVVAVESPTYYGLLQMLESRGLISLEIPCSPRTGMSLEALELAVRTEPRLTAIVVMPNQARLCFTVH